jgi:DNA polymerase-3 subunit delta'
LSLHPYSAPFKAAIIDQAHLMTSEAQNCFLKTLEEPRGKTLLILITEYPEMLFSTILSRVQKIKFYPVERKEIENYLITQGVPKEKTKLISQLSLGKPGVALEFVLDNQKLEKQDKIIKEILKIGNSDLVSRFQYAKDLAVNSEDTREVLEIWLRYFRNALILTVDKKEKIYSLSKLKNILRTIQKINFLISTTNVNPKLALEILLLEL